MVHLSTAFKHIFAGLLSNAVSGTELAVSQPSFLRRRGSNSSLSSLGSKEVGPTLRTCSKCRKLIELHSAKQEQRNLKPDILTLYEVCIVFVPKMTCSQTYCM